MQDRAGSATRRAIGKLGSMLAAERLREGLAFTAYICEGLQV